MVMLKRNTASTPGRGRAEAGYSAAASPRDAAEAFRGPRASMAKPPAALPRTSAAARAGAQSAFHGNAWFIPI